MSAVALERVITAMAGPDARPRPDQVTAVEALAEHRRRVLVVQATGWGKSAVYWAATAALRAAGGGPTLVVSPLLALMRDQIAAAGRPGLRAATVNSTNVDDWDEVLTEMGAGRLDVLLISPERLSNPAFARQLPDLLRAVGLLVIDEAHCISDWGFDFRPDYQRLTRTLLGLAPGTPVLATTATANQRVTADVADQLGDDTVTLRGSLARASLRLAVVPGLSVLDRYAWVADALRELPGSGIVYVLTVAETERVAAFLTEQGLDVAAYSGQTTNRVTLENRLRDNQVKALVYVDALGMGYDKPDLAFCVHLGSPASPVAYQQVGRAAGRWTTPSRCWSRPRPTSGSGNTSPPRDPRRAGRAHPRRTGHRSAESCRGGGGHRHPARPARDRAEDSGGRRGGGSPSRRLGGHRQAVVLRLGQVGCPSPGADGRGRSDAGIRTRRGLPDAVPAAGPGRPRPAAVRSVFGLHR